jgi:hypothetical protein
MVEAANAMLLVVDDMQVQSRTLPCATDVELIEQVVFSLAHQKGLFSSDSLRLRSLDKRIQNIINLVRDTGLIIALTNLRNRHSI